MRRHCAVSVLCVLVLFSLFLPAGAEKNLARPPGTTRYVPMVAQLRALLTYDKAQTVPRMALESLGQSVRKRDIWMVTIHNAAPISATETPAAPKKIFYLCRQHGHEPASTEAALQFITQLVKAPADSPLALDLQHAIVYVVPMANPDGSEAFLRHNAHGKDINRDWLQRTQPETQALYRAVMRLKPDLMTDQHELYPNDTRPDFTETAGEGSGAPERVIQTCQDEQAIVQMSMGAAGLTAISHTVTDRHPARLAHRYGCIVAGVPTLLFETNRLQGSGRTVASRAAAHLQVMLTLLRDMAGERETLLAEAEASPYGQSRGAMLLTSRHKAYARPGQPAAVPVPPAAPAPVSGEPPPAKDSE